MDDDVVNDSSWVQASTATIEMPHKEADPSELQQHILELVRPHLDVLEKPPFNNTQLIVMALVMLNRRVTQSELIVWFCSNFAYYKKIAVAGLCAYTTHDTGELSSVDTEGLSSLQHMMSRYGEGGPFCKHYTPIYRHQDSPGTTLWSTDSRHARIFLRLNAPIESPRGFPFLRLPAEIRNQIYTLVFTLAAGQEFRLYRRYRPRKVPRLSIEDRPRVFESPTDLYDYGKPVSLNKLMALSRVNKEVHSESAAMIYHLNIWTFGSPLCVTQFLSDARRKGPTAFRFVTRIHLNYCPECLPSHRTIASMKRGMGGLRECMRTLLNDPNSQELKLHVNEGDWQNWWQYHSSVLEVPFSCDAIPGIAELNRAKYLRKLELYGDCEEVKKVLKPILTRIKSRKTAAGGGSK